MQQIMNSENPFLLWFDIEKSPKSVWFMGTLLGLFILSEVICAVLIYFILKFLKRHSGSFNDATHRLHRQFTYLLAVQVILV